MTPKEKAKQLFDKFYELHKTSNQPKFRAIDSSLIAVNEILDLGYVPNEKSSFHVYNYYSNVKIELNKL